MPMMPPQGHQYPLPSSQYAPQYPPQYPPHPSSGFYSQPHPSHMAQQPPHMAHPSHMPHPSQMPHHMANMPPQMAHMAQMNMMPPQMMMMQGPPPMMMPHYPPMMPQMNPYGYPPYMPPRTMSSYESSKAAKELLKKYQCSTCSKRFSRPSSLKTHMHSHTGEKPFGCTVASCGRQFSVLSNLKRHMRLCESRNGGPGVELDVELTENDEDVLESEDILHERRETCSTLSIPQSL